MANAAPQQQFESEFRSHLDRHTTALIAALRGIIATPVPAVVKLLAFQMQADWRSYPAHVFAMDDESPDEVYFEPPLFGALLPESRPLVPPGAIDQDGYEEAGVHTFETGARVMAEWFGECWHAAGGDRFPIPVYIHLHDSSDYFELRSRRWTKDAEIWP
jgi:hypothetical protein